MRCPYHGWKFSATGRAVEIPQLEPSSAIPPAACLDTLSVEPHYGLLWVNFDSEASSEQLVRIREYDDAAFRAIRIGAVTYRTGAPVVMDNNTDATHVAFVHGNSFGAEQNPRIPTSHAERTDFGLRVRSDAMPVAQTPTAAEPGSRVATTEVWLPFTQVGRLAYSDGSTHILFKGYCPVDDDHTDVYLTVLRNDVDRPADTDTIIEFELTVEHEDKATLDTVPAGFPLDPGRQVHIKHDRPGIAYRRALRELVAADHCPPPRATHQTHAHRSA